MDVTDYKILGALQANAKLSTRELAEQLNMSRTPVYERVRKLEEQGIIQKYAARINPDLISSRVVVYTQVSLKTHTEEVMVGFETKVRALPEIKECAHISGSTDYLLKIVVPKIEAYRTFVAKNLATFVDVQHVESGFVLKMIKQDEDLFIDPDLKVVL